MKRAFKIAFIFVVLCLSTTKGFSQVSISYYDSSLPKLGMGYNFSEKTWGELRLYTNTTIENLTPELVFCYNMVNKERHNIYVGIGGSANYFDGVVLPMGLQVTPIKTFKNLSVHLELQPMFLIEDDMILQASWGFRYRLGK